MPALPQLTQKDIQTCCPGANFERGLDYYEHDQITNPVRRDERIEANCQGSAIHPYRPWAILSAKGIKEAGCSCPVGFGCKHIAALLLTYMHHPERFHTAETVDKQLEQRDKKELVLLIKAMLAREPDLQILLELPLTGTQSNGKTLDLEPIRRQLQNAFHNGEWGRSTDVAYEMESVLNMAEPFAEAGDWLNVKTICELVLQEGLENYEYAGHDEGEVIGEINRAAVRLADCLPAFVGDEVARIEILDALFDLVRWDTEMGGYGAADNIIDVLLTETDAGERELLRDWIMHQLTTMAESDEFIGKWRRESWGSFLLPLIDAEAFDDFLPQASSLGLHRSLFGKFIELDRIDEAVKIVLEDANSSDYDLLQSALKLENAGYLAQATKMVETRAAEITDERLLVWLAEKREQMGDTQGAMALHRRCWAKRPSLPTYQVLERLAGKLDEWGDVRTELIGGLMESNRDVSVLARIRLHEQAWEAAWAAVEDKSMGYHGDSIRDEIARATEEHCPERVVAYYLSKAEHLIKLRGRNNYASAAQSLKSVKKILHHTQQQDTWQKTINRIHQNHRNLPALRDELSKAGLV